jgi:ABC-2 type transport system permease protein
MNADHNATGGALVFDTADAVDPLDDEFRSLVRYRDFVLLWTKRNISLRYKRSILGMLWTVLEPLAVISILAVVFSAVFRFEIDNYPVYILSGWVMWEFFARATSVMAGDIQATREITSRFRIPRSAFLVASVLSTLFNWVLAMIVLALVMAVMGHPFTWALLAVPPAMLLTALFAFGVGCAVATLAAMFHDFILMYTVVLTMWLYSTPIIYPLAIVPEAAQPLLLLNPLTHLLELIRAPIYEARWPLPAEWMTGIVISMMSAVAGIWILTRSRVAIEYRG